MEDYFFLHLTLRSVHKGVKYPCIIFDHEETAKANLWQTYTLSLFDDLHPKMDMLLLIVLQKLSSYQNEIKVYRFFYHTWLYYVLCSSPWASLVNRDNWSYFDQFYPWGNPVWGRLHQITKQTIWYWQNSQALHNFKTNQLGYIKEIW